MLYQITGIDTTTKEHVTIQCDAPDTEAAGQIGTEKGILIEKIEANDNRMGQDASQSAVPSDSTQTITTEPERRIPVKSNRLSLSLNNPWTFLFTSVVFCLIFIALFQEREKSPLDQKISEHRARSKAIEENREKTLIAWLESQRKGEMGYEYWLDESWVTKVRLFALQSYKIVDQSGCEFTVRIHSSTKGGIPVICLWRIRVGFDDGKIHSVKKNEEVLKEEELQKLLIEKKITAEEYFDRLHQ